MPLFMVFVELIHNGFREENLHTIEASVSYFMILSSQILQIWDLRMQYRFDPKMSVLDINFIFIKLQF